MVKFTLELDVVVGGLLIARLPRSICTETLACDRSMPKLCSACAREFNNLFHIKPSCNQLKISSDPLSSISDIEWMSTLLVLKQKLKTSN